MDNLYQTVVVVCAMLLLYDRVKFRKAYAPVTSVEV